MRVVCTGQDIKHFVKDLLFIGNDDFQDTNGKINIKSVCISRYFSIHYTNID